MVPSNLVEIPDEIKFGAIKESMAETLTRILYKFRT
jgi:hypothetical protein